MDLLDRYVVRRENNVIQVDFRREPDPPAPRFPGAGALRINEECGETLDAFPPAVWQLAPRSAGLRGDGHSLAHVATG